MQTLLGSPRQDLTEAVVLDALSLQHGPRVRWGVDVLDSDDVLVPDESIPAVSGSVTWSYRPPEGLTGASTAAAEVRRRAELVLVGDVSVNLVARRFRIWSELQASSGEWVRFHLGVFLATNPGTDDDGVLVSRTLRLADKTWRYAQRFLTEPLVVAAGTNVVDYVTGDLGSEFGESAFAITASDVTLDEGKFFPAGTSRLALYNTLLETAAYDALTCAEDGRPQSLPLSTLSGKGAEHTYAPGEGKVVTAGSVEPLLPSLPNVVRFVARQGPSLAEEGNGIVTVTNQSTGPGSVDERGEEVQMTVEVDAEDQTQLAETAAAEAQRYFAGGGLRFTGRVGLNPRHSNRDVVSLVKPRLGLSGTWLVTSWTYPLGPLDGEQSVTMPITAEARVA